VNLSETLHGNSKVPSAIAPDWDGILTSKDYLVREEEVAAALREI